MYVYACVYVYVYIYKKTTVLESLFKKRCRTAGLLQVCFSLYLIIHVINVFFNNDICVYFSVSFCSIAFIDNHLIAWDVKIDKMQTWLNLTHKDLVFDYRLTGYNFIKKETHIRAHIPATVFRSGFVNPRKKSVQELV